MSEELYLYMVAKYSMSTDDPFEHKHFVRREAAIRYFKKNLDGKADDERIWFAQYSLPGIKEIELSRVEEVVDEDVGSVDSEPKGVDVHIEELQTRIEQIKLGREVCSGSLEVSRERIKQLETENEALRAVIRLTV